MGKIKKLHEGNYTDGNESFDVEFDGEIAVITAKTDFKYLDLKKGESTIINKGFLESSINEELHLFYRKE